jgi:hypothetical protein
LTIVDTS